jgi:hypothetical protein
MDAWNKGPHGRSGLIERVKAEDPASALAGFQGNFGIGLLAATAFALAPAWVTLLPIIRGT